MGSNHYAIHGSAVTLFENTQASSPVDYRGFIQVGSREYSFVLYSKNFNQQSQTYSGKVFTTDNAVGIPRNRVKVGDYYNRKRRSPLSTIQRQQAQSTIPVMCGTIELSCLASNNDPFAALMECAINISNNRYAAQLINVDNTEGPLRWLGLLEISFTDEQSLPAVEQ
ncbi:MAG: hypothetical protein COA42_21015 [Alteromonadaceae bacterium]|nr:MAG: hypothetical protein COA42_21015 [Alteromonadaceae bacterium]